MWNRPGALRRACAAVLALLGAAGAELAERGYWVDPSPRPELGLGLSHETYSAGMHAQGFFFRLEGLNPVLARLDGAYHLHTLTWDESVENPFDYFAHEVEAGVEFRFGRILRTRLEGGIRAERSGAATSLRARATWIQGFDVKAWRLGFEVGQGDPGSLAAFLPAAALFVEESPTRWLTARVRLRYQPAWAPTNFQSGEFEGGLGLLWSLGSRFKIRTAVTVRSEPDIVAELEGRFEDREAPRAPIATLGASWGPVGEVRAAASLEFRLLRKPPPAIAPPAPIAASVPVPAKAIGRILAAPLFNATSEPEFDYLGDLYARVLENRIIAREGAARINVDEGARNLVLFFRQRDLAGPDPKIAEILLEKYGIEWLLVPSLRRTGTQYAVELRVHRLRAAGVLRAQTPVDPRNRERLSRDADSLLNQILPLGP
ncbi:MAG: hypothetical protein J0L75_08665 [Spirochaetes bacterium]|nr:hypothetical protein [Spirochaetota bacterium]